MKSAAEKSRGIINPWFSFHNFDGSADIKIIVNNVECILRTVERAILDFEGETDTLRHLQRSFRSVRALAFKIGFDESSKAITAHVQVEGDGDVEEIEALSRELMDRATQYAQAKTMQTKMR